MISVPIRHPVGLPPQGDTLQSKATLSLRKVTVIPHKATLFGIKATLSRDFALDPVNVSTPSSAEAERLGGKAGMGLNLPAAGTTMAP